MLENRRKEIILRTILILSVFFTLFLCASQASSSESKLSPCDDSLYLKLKQKNIDSLSQNEMQYYLNKDNQCLEFTKEIIKDKKEIENENNNKSQRKNIGRTIFFFGFFVPVVVVFMVLLGTGTIKF